MTRKTNYISILQFDERLISRMRVHRSAKGIEVVSFDQERGQWSTREALEAALKAFAARHHLGEDAVCTVLPRYDMTARILELPSQDPAEIEGMVRLSAEEYVPFPAEELVTDQCILAKSREGGSKVLAVFAHRDVVETHVRLLQGAQLEPDGIYLSTACLASAAIAAGAGIRQRHALVNLASGGLEVLVIGGQRVDYGRAVASQQDWNLATGTPAEILEELSVEVRASLSAYRRESQEGEDAETVYLCSEGVEVTEHCLALFHEIGLECSPARFALDLVAHGADRLPTLPLVSLGAALIAQDRGAVSIQLLPKSLIRSRERAGVKKKAINLGALAAAIMVMLIALYAQAMYQRNAYLRDLNKRIARIEPRAAGIFSKQKQLWILRRQVERTGSVIELLASLIDLFPASDMNISHFVFTHHDRIEVTGRTRSLKTYQKFIQTLTEAGKASIPQFARAQSLYENETDEKGQQVWDFKFVLPFPEAPSATEETGSESFE